MTSLKVGDLVELREFRRALALRSEIRGAGWFN
jgi:hypothetical protein